MHSNSQKSATKQLPSYTVEVLHLLKVPAGGCRVKKRQFELLVWANDKHLYECVGVWV